MSQLYKENSQYIYIPTTISREAQEFLRIYKNDFEYGEYTNPSLLRAKRERFSELLECFLTQFKEKLVDNIEEKEMSGIPVVVITPKNYNEKMNDKAVIYTHGGAYYFGTPVSSLSTGIAYELGIKVYAIDYRLGPEHPYPCAFNDTFSVFKEIICNFKPENTVWISDSAGGNLALAVLLKAKKEDFLPIAALALSSPWTDVSGDCDTFHTLEKYDPVLSRIFINQAGDGYFKCHNKKDPFISPVYGDYSGGFSPTIITTGTRDMLLSDSIRLYRQLKRCGIETELNVWEGMWHVFEAFGYPIIPEAVESLKEIASFLRKKLEIE